jgi:hypothetical protein
MRVLILIICLCSFSSIGISQSTIEPADGVRDNLDNKTYELDGRKIVFVPELILESDLSAKIVLQIIVKKNGKILSVKPNRNLTNTNNAALIKQSIDNAFLYRFNRCSKCDKGQIGTITFRYKAW